MNSNANSVNLTELTFKQELGYHKTMIVMFYAPWCSYSKELLPIWEEMSKSISLIEEDKNILIAKVDCVQESNLYYSEDIQSFPTIKSYVNYNNISIIYDGERDSNTMWRYFRLLNQQYVEEIMTMDEFSELQENILTPLKPLVLIILNTYDSLDENNLRNQKIDASCKKSDRVTCIITRNPLFATEFQLDIPSITLFSIFENNQMEISKFNYNIDEINSEYLSNWLTIESYPILLELTNENENLIFTNQRIGYENHILILFPNLNTKKEKLFMNHIKKIAKQFNGRCIFVYINLSKLTEYSKTILETLDIIHITSKFDSNLPMMYGIFSRKTDVSFYNGFSMNELEYEKGLIMIEYQDITINKVINWIESTLSGTIKPTRVNALIE